MCAQRSVPLTPIASKQRVNPPNTFRLPRKSIIPRDARRRPDPPLALPVGVKEDLGAQHADAVAGAAGGHLHDLALGHGVPWTAAACEGSCCLAARLCR